MSPWILPTDPKTPKWANKPDFNRFDIKAVILNLQTADINRDWPVQSSEKYVYIKSTPQIAGVGELRRLENPKWLEHLGSF